MMLHGLGEDNSTVLVDDVYSAELSFPWLEQQQAQQAGQELYYTQGQVTEAQTPATAQTAAVTPATTAATTTATTTTSAKKCSQSVIKGVCDYTLAIAAGVLLLIAKTRSGR